MSASGPPTSNSCPARSGRSSAATAYAAVSSAEIHDIGNCAGSGNATTPESTMPGLIQGPRRSRSRRSIEPRRWDRWPAGSPPPPAAPHRHARSPRDDVRTGVEHHELDPAAFAASTASRPYASWSTKSYPGALEVAALDAVIRRRETLRVTQVGHRDPAPRAAQWAAWSASRVTTRVPCPVEELVLNGSSLGARCTVDESGASHWPSRAAERRRRQGAPEGPASSSSRVRLVHSKPHLEGPAATIIKSTKM